METVCVMLPHNANVTRALKVPPVQRQFVQNVALGMVRATQKMVSVHAKLRTGAWPAKRELVLKMETKPVVVMVDVATLVCVNVMWGSQTRLALQQYAQSTAVVMENVTQKQENVAVLIPFMVQTAQT